MLGFVGQLKELRPRLIEVVSCFIITAFRCNCIQGFQCCARFEIACYIGQGAQFFIRRHHAFLEVALAYTPFFVHEFGRKVAGAMEIQIGRQYIGGERIYLPGEMLRNMAVPQVFAHGRGVLAFSQRTIVGLPRA